MRSFVSYFLERSLGERIEVISESSSMYKRLKSVQIERLYDKYRNVQYGDVEEALDAAADEVRTKKPADEASAKRLLLKSAEKILSSLNKKKKSAKKSLSCVRAIKSSVPDGETKPIHVLMKRAERILTNREKKVLSMCADGKSVRTIGKEMGMSYPTVWRDLNSAIDKIRVSHGMKSRNLDIRKR